MILVMFRLTNHEWMQHVTKAFRIIIAGPPASGKTKLAKAVAEHFKVRFSWMDFLV